MPPTLMVLFLAKTNSIRTELVGGMGKYGRLLGWLYIGDAELSLNEQMITEGYAWEI